ncbi:MAG: tetratricopeptide repeat protein [Vicinamibacterales bacterium]
MRTSAVLIVLQLVTLHHGYAGTTSFEPALVQGHPAVRDLRLYRALVERYRAGDNDAVADLLSWDVNRLGAATMLIAGPRDPTGRWTGPDFKIAATLHTAAAIRSFDDGMSGIALIHISLAKDHLGRGRKELTTFSSRWFFAVSRLLQLHGRYIDAEAFLETGRRFFPSDPNVLYESALLQEFSATKWERSEFLVFRRRALQPFPRNNRSERLKQAEQWFRESLRLSPTNIMGRLHLGRVLMMRGESREAAEQFRAVVASTEDRATEYLAWIFLAGVHEREGRLEAAEAAYREAIRAFDQGQSAYLGLSEVLQRLNRADESRAVLRQLLTEARDRRREPWSWYLREPEQVTRERIDTVLKEGRR